MHSELSRMRSVPTRPDHTAWFARPTYDAMMRNPRPSTLAALRRVANYPTAVSGRAVPTTTAVGSRVVQYLRATHGQEASGFPCQGYPRRLFLVGHVRRSGRHVAVTMISTVQETM